MELLTAAQIAKELNLPESTVRYYRDRFTDYIPMTGEGRNRRTLARWHDDGATFGDMPSPLHDS